MITIIVLMQIVGVSVLTYWAYQWGRADQRKADTEALHEVFRGTVGRVKQ